MSSTAAASPMSTSISTGGIGADVLTENGVVVELAALAREATLAETGQQHLGKRPSRSSDQSFWGVGIPSMYGTVSHQPPGPVKMRNPLGWWWHTPHDLIDKVDEQFLMRDTRVVVATLSRLLNDAVLPLDPAAHAASLVEELRVDRGEAQARIRARGRDRGRRKRVAKGSVPRGLEGGE